MSLGAVALIVLAAVFHAGWNIAAKRVPGGAAFVWLNSAASALLFAPLGGYLLITSDAPVTTVLYAALITSLLHGSYFLVLQRGYALGDISVVYPLARGTGPLLSVILAIALLGERPTAMGLAGAGLVVTGVVVIGLSGPRLPGAGGVTAGVLYGVATGLIIACYTLWDAYSVRILALSPILVSWGSNLGQSLLLAPLAVRRRAEVAAVWRMHRREVLAVAIGSPVAYMLVLFAMRISSVALVAPGRELSVVLVSLAGWLLFREPAPLRRLVGATIVLGGIVLLSVGG